MKRDKFITRTITLWSDVQIQTLRHLAANLPCDPLKPLEVVIREQVKARKPDQNALMWAGPLRDMAEQAYSAGRSYSADVWHEYLKRELLPEECDAELCKEGYRKWDFTPGGERVLVGSTKDLTIKGMAQYITQLEAFGASLGVQFHANPNEARGGL